LPGPDRLTGAVVGVAGGRGADYCVEIIACGLAGCPAALRIRRSKQHAHRAPFGLCSDLQFMAEFRHTKSLDLIIDIDYLRLLRTPVFAAQRQQVIDAMRRAGLDSEPGNGPRHYRDLTTTNVLVQ
jgi:hypothetical protein